MDKFNLISGPLRTFDPVISIRTFEVHIGIFSLEFLSELFLQLVPVTVSGQDDVVDILERLEGSSFLTQ